MTANLEFEPRQIVCLENQGTYLYAEVVQIASTRQLCWARPLLLLETTSTPEFMPTYPLMLLGPEQVRLYDLRQSADLLWPAQMFRPALDTEVLPLLAQLYSPEPHRIVPATHQQLRTFVEQVWQAHMHEFPA